MDTAGRHPDSTRVYAKVDLAALRIVGDFDLKGLDVATPRPSKVDELRVVADFNLEGLV